MKTLRLFALFLSLGFRNFLIYRMSALLTIIFSLLLLAGEVVTIDIYYRFGHSIGDWTEGQFLILLGSLNIMTVLYTFFFEVAHDELIFKIRQGELDFDLLRPIDSQLLTSLCRVDFPSLASLPIPIWIVLLGLSMESLSPSVGQILFYLILIPAGTTTIYLINQIATTCSFWFTDSSNFTAACEQLVHMGSRPLQLYPRFVRLGLAYVVPIILCSNLSVVTLTEGIAHGPIAATIGAIALLFLIARIQWKLALRRYASCSS